MPSSDTTGHSNRNASPRFNIVWVCGAPHSGKSTYIADRFGDSPDLFLDLFQFQAPGSYPDTIPYDMRTYLSNTVMEYELYRYLMDQTAPSFMRNGETGLDETTKPGEELLVVLEGTFLRKARRAPFIQTIKNVLDGRAEHEIELVWMDSSQSCCAYDVPDSDEGYDKVTFISDYSPASELSELKKMVDRRNSIDYISDKGYFSFGE